ncbi:NADPH-dependent FMN reductase [Bremerella sp. T1]|uniref:NADPH-dependent FMN reductase n=1 Tax=Bremerella sp. TYQ1 TaxID=3119568 RepID=UPI001CC96502|nr:NAD(P)H-dependent oxidoreductase [Bremerella volcania]UBM34665.1 NAD(P)H-dependent oxidoreductase [Bremerella volcania]
MSRPKILAFAGSARRDSFNKKLVRIAARGAEEAGAEVTLLDLADFPLPLYDGDLEAEQGIPENAKALKELFLAHQGLLLSCPEYNSSITPLLKNTIDWVSRPFEGEQPLAAYKNKICALMSASPGGLGGLRGLVHVRAILQNIGVIVLPKQMAISQANNAFADDGSLNDSKQQETILSLGKSVFEFVDMWR